VTAMTEVEKTVCVRALERLVGDETGVEYALLASADGFEVAGATRTHALNGARVAAMASSIFAVGSAMAGELRLESCRNLVVEAEKGFLTLLTVPCARAPLVLWTVALKETTLGMVLMASRACARDLARLLDLGYRVTDSPEEGATDGERE
jgi:predicted regulator of Ras-like GTPase activity (Roadblock/LC7/MglB family)